LRSKNFILLLLFFFLLPPLTSYANEEAATAIFQRQISDVDVDLFIQGSWDISVTGSIGYDLSAGTFIETPFPQMAPGFVFSQIPDLTISLWLMNRYFFETTIKEDSEQNTFLLGYQGKENEFVQRVLIGNTRIDIEDYAFLSIPSIPNNSLGASAAFRTRLSYHELLLRYDPAVALTKEFVGSNEVRRQTFMPTDYFRGRMFILPDTDFDNLEVYIEDDRGNFTGSDRRRYRRADNTDFIFSISDGTITLRNQPESRILVYYTKGGVSIGDYSLGRDALVAVDSNGTPQPNGPPVHFHWNAIYSGQSMTRNRVTINGNQALLIFNRGEYSPFESLSFYQSAFPLPEDSTRIRFGISAKSNNPEVIDERLRIRVERDLNLIYVYRNAYGVRDMRNRYPLFDKFPVPVYGPLRDIVPGSYRNELRLEVLVPVSSFMLGPGVLPGSVVVMRNGNLETMYSVDYHSGVVTFRTFIHPNDRIRITYKSSFIDTDGGDLLFATGNRFFIGDFLTTELAFGIKWNILQNQYSRFPGQYKGSMLFTGGATYTRDNYRIEVDTGLSITSQDTTGILRLFDMQQSGIPLRLGLGHIYPASIPHNETWNFMSSGFPPAVLPTRENRGKLIYKDYHSYSLTTATLNNYNWSVPSGQIHSYTTGNHPGPYPAMASNDGVVGEVLIMDMEEIPNNWWAGAQIPLRRFAPRQDLSGAESISFIIKAENVMGGRLFIQIGTICEDLDGDGILDREESIHSRGFAFNDIANGTVMRIGGNGLLESEDMDGNGVLDLEDPRNVVTIELESLLAQGGLTLTAISADGNWFKINHIFTVDERTRLAQTSAVRFIYINDSGALSSGRILIGELFIKDSPFSATASGSAHAQEIFERQSVRRPPRMLVDAYPEVRNIFFRNADIPSTQKVLESGWDGTGYTLTGFSTPVPFGMYRKLAGYIRIPHLGSPNPASFTISFTDTNSRGVTAEFQTEPFYEWKKFEIDIERRRIYLAGVDMGGIVTTTSTNLGLSMFRVTSNSNAGILYLDEVHLTDPKVSTAAGIAVTYEHNFPGPLLSIGETNIISNLYIREYVMYTSEEFSVDLNDNSSASNARTRTTLRTDIFNSNLETNIDLSWAGGENYSTIDHTYRSPLFTDFITFTDSYSESRDLHTLSFAKYDELAIRIGERGGIASVSAESILIYSDLSQRWNFRYRSDRGREMHGGTNLTFIKTSTYYDHHDSSYLANWVNSFSLILPVDSDPWPDRTILSESNFSAARESFGVDLFINAGATSTGEDRDRRQRNSGRAELQFPFFNRSFGGWRLTPGYSRSFDYINRNISGTSFVDDTQLWFEDFSRQTYFYTAIPFAEFFLESFEKKFQEESQYLSSSRYTPEVFVRFFKSRTPSMADFFVPSEFNVRYLKEFSKENDTFMNTYRIRGEYVTRAINMFGTAGLSPLFSFYRTDEFITRISLTTSSVDTPVPQDRELGIRNSFYFAGHRETELVIDNRFRYVHRFTDNRTYFYDTLSASFMWVTRPTNEIRIRHLSTENDPAPYFVHTESLIFSTEPQSSLSDHNSWSLLLTHESSLVFPAKGNIRVLLSIGLERHKLYDSYDSASVYLLGLQAGIFGRVMF